MPGTVAGSQVEVSTPVRARVAPVADPTRLSYVSVQPDSIGIVPSAPTWSAGGGAVCTPKSVQPTAAGREFEVPPYTWMPLRPRGLRLARADPVSRT